MIFGLPIDLLVIRATALLAVMAAHGFAVAFVADRLGDGAARTEKRLTLNALRHLDPIGAPAFAFSGGYGWIRQIPVDGAKLRFGRAGLLLIVVAGTAATLLVALLAALLSPTIPASGNWQLIADLLGVTTSTAIAFALFDLLPIPPLTGGLLLGIVAPPLCRWFSERALLPALVIVLFLLFGALQDWLDPVVSRLVAALPG
ncbi:MAG: hypothetical protein IT534_06280 [Bauldia sp.]|nr:hypothetical protein [Bauldia sp.]